MSLPYRNWGFRHRRRGSSFVPDALIQALVNGQYGQGGMLRWFWGNKPLVTAQEPNTMLSINADNTKFDCVSFDGVFSGVVHRIPTLTGIAMSGATLPVSSGAGVWHYGIWSITVDSSGTVTVTGATDNATGYTFSSQAVAALPAIPTGSTRIGYVLVTTTNVDPFVPGTTPLSGVANTVAVTLVSDVLIGSTILIDPTVGSPTDANHVSASNNWSVLTMMDLAASEPRWCRLSDGFDANRVDLRAGATGSGADIETASLAWSRSHRIRMNPLTASVVTA